MRSALIYVPLRYRFEIERLLEALSPRQSVPWLASDEDGTAGAYITTATNWQVDLTEDQIQVIQSSVGPGVLLVQIDLSGRAPTSVALKVVEALARVCPGAALDDYSDDLWTLSDAAAGALRDGRRFLERS